MCVCGGENYVANNYKMDKPSEKNFKNDTLIKGGGLFVFSDRMWFVGLICWSVRL